MDPISSIIAGIIFYLVLIGGVVYTLNQSRKMVNEHHRKQLVRSERSREGLDVHFQRQQLIKIFDKELGNNSEGHTLRQSFGVIAGFVELRELGARTRKNEVVFFHW